MPATRRTSTASRLFTRRIWLYRRAHRRVRRIHRLPADAEVAYVLRRYDDPASCCSVAFRMTDGHKDPAHDVGSRLPTTVEGAPMTVCGEARRRYRRNSGVGKCTRSASWMPGPQC
jgi:hypothetical protein